MLSLYNYIIFKGTILEHIIKIAINNKYERTTILI